jgi:ribosomal protein L35AE/L33A
MYVLRIEHAVPDYEGWKRVFDSDPVGREKSGVRRYQVLRAVDDPRYVLIDLEFDTKEQADALLAGLRKVWSRVEGQVMRDPKVRIAQVEEAKEFAR